MTKSKSLQKFVQVMGGLFILLLLISLFSKAICQKPELHLPSIWIKEQTGRYEFANPAKLLGWGALAVAGWADGAVEGYEFDGRIAFEKGWGKSPASFWGSESWRNVYRGGNPDNGFKSRWAEWRGARDFYHTADDVRKFGYITGGVVIGIGGKQVNVKWWHYALDAAISFGVSATAKHLGMRWVRALPHRRR